MFEDPIVAEVRKTREMLASQFDFDLHAIFEDLRKRQSSLGERLLRTPNSREVNKTAQLRETNSVYRPEE